MSVIFQSEEARERMRGWFDRFLTRTSVAVEQFETTTSFGATHGLFAGPEGGEPLVVLHGAMATSAHVLPELAALAETRRLIVVDVVGQSPMSEDRRVELGDDSYGRWLSEVCDEVGLGSFDLLGVSWGGFVAVKGALAMPARVRKLVLLVPAGFVTGSMWKGFWKMGLPMMQYAKKPSPSRLAKVVGELFTTRDPLWEEFFGEAVLAYRMDMRIPPRWKEIGFAGPVFVAGAEEDLSFPGEKLVARAKELLPQASTWLIEGSKHCPPTTEEFRRELAGKVEGFLAG